MDIFVCVKQVPDTATHIQISSRHVDLENVNWIVNPFDEFAVELALQLIEAAGEGRVHLVSLGPDRAKEALQMGMAMGADSAYHLHHQAFQDGDPFSTAKALAAFLQDHRYDLVLCGKQSADDDAGQVGILVAEFLSLPQVTGVRTAVWDDDSHLIAEREVGGAIERIRTPLPALLTVDKGERPPRHPSLKGIMTAKRKGCFAVAPDQLGLTPKELGSAGGLTKRTAVAKPAAKEAGVLLQGEPDRMVGELVERLRQERGLL